MMYYCSKAKQQFFSVIQFLNFLIKAKEALRTSSSYIEKTEPAIFLRNKVFHPLISDLFAASKPA
jgi:hypothetical protein